MQKKVWKRFQNDRMVSFWEMEWIQVGAKRRSDFKERKANMALSCLKYSIRGEESKNKNEEFELLEGKVKEQTREEKLGRVGEE